MVAFNPFSSEPLKASLTTDDTSASTNPVEYSLAEVSMSAPVMPEGALEALAKTVE